MISILNRKELCITYSMQEQGELRERLKQHGIKYDLKTINRESPSPVAAGSRARMGSAGADTSRMYEYIFYVHKDDILKAREVVQCSRGK